MNEKQKICLLFEMCIFFSLNSNITVKFIYTYINSESEAMIRVREHERREIKAKTTAKIIIYHNE